MSREENNLLDPYDVAILLVGITIGPLAMRILKISQHVYGAQGRTVRETKVQETLTGW